MRKGWHCGFYAPVLDNCESPQTSHPTGLLDDPPQLLSHFICAWDEPGTRHSQNLFFSFIIHMCIQGLVHFSPLPQPPPLPPTPPPPSPPHPLNTQQKLFCPYF
jgi:hypothetical protein